MRRMWKFATRNFRIEWLIEREPVDTSYMDPALAQECRTKVRSGEWKCFSSCIRVVHKRTGEVLAEEWLGNSIYANPAEFRDHIGSNGQWGSYFTNMVRRAVADARKQFLALQQSAQARCDTLAKCRLKAA